MISLIFRREAQRVVTSPFFWLLIVFIQIGLAFIFLTSVQNYVTIIQPTLIKKSSELGVTAMVIAPYTFWLAITILLLIPIVTMRTFSEEKQLGTWAIILSAPVRIRDLVIGKYLSIVLICTLIIVAMEIMPFSLALGTSLDWGLMASMIFGLFLLITSFAAAGLFISSIFNQPVFAALTCFSLLAFLWVLYAAGEGLGKNGFLYREISNFSHIVPFLQGQVNSWNILYFILFTFVFLSMTILALDIQRMPH